MNMFIALATNTVATWKKGPVVMVDARKTGRTLPNQSAVMTLWNGRNVDWSVKNENAAKYPISGFVDYVELIACTGGNKDRDLFKNPGDRTVMDDYDFEPLAKVCREILNMGAKPYLKLGNVPQKFTGDYSGGEFSINVRPPTDHLLHYRYMQACAAALKAAFGKDEVRKWRFAVLTEADNTGWFKAKSGDRDEIREDFFKLYDYAAKAFEEELGEGLVFGTHLLNPTDSQMSQFSAKDVVAHCAAGTNYATGKIGAPLKLLTISYYSRPNYDRLEVGKIIMMQDIVDIAVAAGHKDLVTGVDEGRIIISTKGAQKHDLATRVVGQSYEAAFDVRIAKSIFDAGADYCASWGYFSGPAVHFQGIPSFNYFTSREIALFGGMKRADASVSGTVPVHEEVDAVAAVSPDGRTVRVMASRFRDRLVLTNALDAIAVIRLPAVFAGKTVAVSALTLDDRNNWFVDWCADRVKYGVKNSDFSWSPDDPAPLGGKGLTDPAHRELFIKELQPRYAEKAASVKPAESRLQVPESGNITLPLRFVGNGAAFLSVSTVLWNSSTSANH